MGRVWGFTVFRGILSLGYMLGLVTVLKSFGFLSFRVVFRVVLGFFFYCWVGFMVFLAFRGILVEGYILGLVTVW